MARVGLWIAVLVLAAPPAVLLEAFGRTHCPFEGEGLCGCRQHAEADAPPRCPCGGDHQQAPMPDLPCGPDQEPCDCAPFDLPDATSEHPPVPQSVSETARVFDRAARIGGALSPIPHRRTTPVPVFRPLLI